MWADTIAIRVDSWLVGIRVDTQAAASAVRRHYADQLVDDAARADSNYTVIAPHLLKGHGTLYRAGVVMAEPRRMVTLLSLLDAELATLSVPDGCLRVVATVHQLGGGVILEPTWRSTGSPPPATPAVPLWVDPGHRTVQIPDGSIVPLHGVVLVADEMIPTALTSMPTPADAAADEIWLDLLTDLSVESKLRVCPADALAGTLAELSIS